MTHIEELDLTLNQNNALVLERGITTIEGITEKILHSIDGRLSSGIRKKLEAWKMDNDDAARIAELPEVKDPLDYTDLAFGQRLEGIRREIESIQKKAQKDVPWSAVLFDDLLEKVRPLAVRWGISWHTFDCKIPYEPKATHGEGGLMLYDTMMVYAVRFQCVEASNQPHDSECRDVVVVTHAFDVYDPQATFPQGDKGPGKAHTYAQKYALRIILNLPAGDDPDFIPMAALSTRARMERETLIGQLRKAIEAVEQDPDEVIPKWLENLNKHFSRSITSIDDADDDVIRKAIFHFEEKAR